MFRTIFLAMGLAIMAVFSLSGPVAPVSADGGPHGQYADTSSTVLYTDKCAGCHRVHQGKSVGKLLKAESQYALCLTCHNGAGSVLNVLDGVKLTALESVAGTTPRDAGASISVSVTPYGDQWAAPPPDGGTTTFTLRIRNITASAVNVTNIVCTPTPAALHSCSPSTTAISNIAGNGTAYATVTLTTTDTTDHVATAAITVTSNGSGDTDAAVVVRANFNVSPEGGVLNGGGFRFVNGKQVTSRHNADPADQSLRPWGYSAGQNTYLLANNSATTNSGGKPVTALDSELQCTSCHNPHGTANYRLLKERVNDGYPRVRASVYKLVYSGTVTRTGGATAVGDKVSDNSTGAFGYVVADDTANSTLTLNAIIRQGSTAAPWSFDGDDITVLIGEAGSTRFTATGSAFTVVPNKDEGGVRGRETGAPPNKYVKDYYFSSGNTGANDTRKGVLGNTQPTGPIPTDYGLATLCGSCHNPYPSMGAGNAVIGPTSNPTGSLTYNAKTGALVGAKVQAGDRLVDPDGDGGTAFVAEDSSTTNDGTLIVANISDTFDPAATDVITVYEGNSATATRGTVTVAASGWAYTATIANAVHYRHKTEMSFMDWSNPESKIRSYNPEKTEALGLTQSDAAALTWDVPAGATAGVKLARLRLASSDGADTRACEGGDTNDTNCGKDKTGIDKFVTCLTCHRVHGSSSDMTGWSLKKSSGNTTTGIDFGDEDLTPSQGVIDAGAAGGRSLSTLLYTNNRGMCEACHQWGIALPGQ